MKKGVIVFLFVGLMFQVVLARDFVVVGQVFDSKTKSALLGVSIYDEKTLLGAETDEEGFFYIKCNDEVQTLLISCLGYRTKKVRIRKKENQALRIELDEKQVWLQELSVIPGLNPAKSIIEKVIEHKKENDPYSNKDYVARGKSDELILIENSKSRSMGLVDLLSHAVDSSQKNIPLLLKSSEFTFGKKGLELQSLSEKSTLKNVEPLFEKIIGTVPFSLNFYNPTLILFGKGFISPLSPSGSHFYRYILKDSIEFQGRKIYKISFRSLNESNLTFNGICEIDGETYALTKIKLELPLLSNINFVRRIDLDLEYSKDSLGNWTPRNEIWDLTISGQLFESAKDEAYFRILKHNQFENKSETFTPSKVQFLGSKYREDDINQRMESLKGSPTLRSAAWIADAYLTSYMKLKYIDIGKVYRIARHTEQEGLRLNLPFRTNERISNKLSIGGYLGYGIRNQKWNYQGEIKFRIPTITKTVVSFRYTEDLRRFDYSNSDYFQKENPNFSGDADIYNTLFRFKSESNMYRFNEVSSMISHDWNTNFESRIYFRNENIYSNHWFEFADQGATYSRLNHQKISLVNRLSFDAKNYEDHMNRIYMRNWLPVFYMNLDAGRYNFDEKQGNYGRFTFTATQRLLFPIGQMDYFVEGSTTLGATPWPLKYQPSTAKFDIFGRYRFSLLNPFEYIADHYVYVNIEWILNGLILNRIPYVDYLKLREIITLKFLYGGINTTQLMELPGEYRMTGKPYAELSAGVTNVFKILTLQGIWRLTQSQLEGVSPSRFSVALRISF